MFYCDHLSYCPFGKISNSPLCHVCYSLLFSMIDIARYLTYCFLGVKWSPFIRCQNLKALVPFLSTLCIIPCIVNN